MTAATIVVPSRGGARRLPTLLTSALAQTSSDFEIVVVLDGDIDDSASVLAEWTDRLALRVICFPENRGRAAALNAGFRAAHGRVLIRADDDLELEPDFVEHHVALHEGEARGVVAMCRDVFPETPYAAAYGRAADERIRAAASVEPPETRWRWWSGNVSTTAETFERVGDYDEDFRAYGWEDVEWGYRLHLAGIPVVIAPGFSTLHHGPVTTTAERASRAFASGAARRRFERKHGADAIPAPRRNRSPWSIAVATTATACNARSVAMAGRALDRVVGVLPHRVAEKGVALLVEASAVAGRGGRE